MSASLIKSIIINFNYIIIYYVLVINFIYFVQLILAAFNLNDYMKRIRYSDYKKYIVSSNMIPISILVPAYNEEETIVENIKSLLALNYPLFEVIVINDGSKDDTLKKVIEAFELKKVDQPVRYLIKTNKIKAIYRNIDIPNLILVDKENGGKADALNAGINVSNYPVIASIDADSILESDSLVRVVMPFIEDKKTIAVGGIVRIANGSTITRGRVIKIDLPKSRIAMFQIVEYLRAFLTGRVGWDSINSLLIVSGAFGAFRKDAVVEVGGYAKNTIGEDMELIVKLHEHFLRNKRDYRIKFVPDPVCWSQAPERIRDLRGQRRRWQIGLMDSLFKHKRMFFNPKYKKIGLIAVPYFWIFEMFGPIIEILGYILIPLAYMLGVLNLKYFILFLAASILYGILLSLGAILLEEYTFNKYPSLKQLLRLSLYGVLENFGYRQMTTLFRVEGIIKFRKMKHNWGKIKRHSFEAKSLKL
ncbi:glycosyltransferase family 2 protein [Thermoanaerobacter wiegelii]